MGVLGAHTHTQQQECSGLEGPYGTHSASETSTSVEHSVVTPCHVYFALLSTSMRVPSFKTEVQWGRDTCPMPAGALIVAELSIWG
jgi:hypothetical protein